MAPDRPANMWLWGAALALIALAFWPGLDLPGRGPREALLPACAVALLAFGIARGQRSPHPWLSALLGAALAASILGVLRAPGPERAAVARDAIVLAAPWIACLAAALWRDRADGNGIDRAIERGAVLSLAAISGIGLVQAWTGWQGIGQVAPPAALFVNRNVAAQAVVLLLPLTAVELLRPGRRPWRWVALAAEVGGLSFLLATRARGAWLGLACGTLVAALVLFRSRRTAGAAPAWPRLAVAVALAALAALIPVRSGVGTMPALGSTLLTLAQPTVGSGGVRMALWSNTLAMTGDRAWMGHGAGRFPVVYPLYQSSRRPTPDFGTTYQPAHAHNDWLEYASELGWPAAAALLAALLTGIFLCVRGCAAGDRSQGLRCAARAAVLASVLGHGLLSFPLHAPAGAFVAWLVIGRAWTAVGGVRSPTPGASRLAAGAALLLAFGLLVLGVGELRSRAALGQALKAQRVGDCAAALPYAITSARSSRLRGVSGSAAMIVYECDPDPLAARRTLERALVLHPNNLNLLLAVGSRRMKAGLLDEAQDAYRRATRIVPDQARGWAGLAMAQALSGDRAAAGVSCAEALRLEPGLAPARAFCEANELVRDAP